MALFVHGVEPRANDAEMFSAVERTEAARDLLFDLGHIRAIHAELKGAHGVRTAAAGLHSGQGAR